MLIYIRHSTYSSTASVCLNSMQYSCMYNATAVSGSIVYTYIYTHAMMIIPSNAVLCSRDVTSWYCWCTQSMYVPRDCRSERVVLLPLLSHLYFLSLGNDRKIFSLWNRNMKTWKYGNLATNHSLFLSLQFLIFCVCCLFSSFTSCLY